MHTILNQNLEKYLEGRLSADVQASLDAHMSECSSCRTELDEMLESHQLLSVFAVTEDDPALEPTPGFSIKVLQSIDAAGRPAPWWMAFPQSLQMFRQVALAAVLLVVLASGYVLTLQTTSASTTAELLVDMPSYRQAPAALFTHQHTGGGHGTDKDRICLQCWKSSKMAAASSDNHDVREVALASLVSDGE